MVVTVVGLVLGQDVAAGPPDRTTELDIERLRALGGNHVHDIAATYPRPGSEAVVDEHIGIALEVLRKRECAHGGQYSHTRACDIVRDIAQDVAQPLQLLLKAVRGLPEDEQDVVLAYLIERDQIASGTPRRVVAFGEPASLSGPWESPDSRRWRAALLLSRVAAGAGIDEVAAELRLPADAVRAALRDLASRAFVSERLAGALRSLAEGHTLEAAAAAVEVDVAELAAEFGPTEALIAGLTATLVARSALPELPAGIGSGRSEPLSTLPVRFPETLYDRLKAWSEEHGFPMAVVVRGLVERFLDEQQRRVA
jgi:hypothetical protein